MDMRLQGILESLLTNVRVLNEEMMRLGRSDLLIPSTECLRMIDLMKGVCLCTLQNLGTIERGLLKHRSSVSLQAEDTP